MIINVETKIFLYVIVFLFFFSKKGIFVVFAHTMR